VGNISFISFKELRPHRLTTRIAQDDQQETSDGQVHSIIGTRCAAGVTGAFMGNGRANVCTEVVGSAYMTGLHQFVLAALILS
jgi:proline racemase